MWGNQKTESFVYDWVHAHATFDVMYIECHFKCCVDTLVTGNAIVQFVKTFCLKKTDTTLLKFEQNISSFVDGYLKTLCFKNKKL